MHPTPPHGMGVVARRQAFAAVAKRAVGVGCGGQMRASVIGFNRVGKKEMWTRILFQIRFGLLEPTPPPVLLRKAILRWLQLAATPR